MFAASMAAAEAGGSELVAPEAVAFPPDAVAAPPEAVAPRLGNASGATSSPRRKSAQATAPPPRARSRTTTMTRAGRDLIGRSFGRGLRDF
jgi:hypothetical protein